MSLNAPPYKLIIKICCFFSLIFYSFFHFDAPICYLLFTRLNFRCVSSVSFVLWYTTRCACIDIRLYYNNNNSNGCTTQYNAASICYIHIILCFFSSMETSMNTIFVKAEFYLFRTALCSLLPSSPHSHSHQTSPFFSYFISFGCTTLFSLFFIVDVVVVYFFFFSFRFRCFSYQLIHYVCLCVYRIYTCGMCVRCCCCSRSRDETNNFNFLISRDCSCSFHRCPSSAVYVFMSD